MGYIVTCKYQEKVGCGAAQLTFLYCGFPHISNPKTFQVQFLNVKD